MQLLQQACCTIRRASDVKDISQPVTAYVSLRSLPRRLQILQQNSMLDLELKVFYFRYQKDLLNILRVHIFA